MTRYILDTNILIRYLRADQPEHAKAVRQLFSEASSGDCTLILLEVAVAEAVWVLSSVYSAERSKIAEGLRKVILSAGVRCKQRDQMLDALDRYAGTNCDFLDCYIAAMAADSGDHVASFDKDFRKFPDVKRWAGAQ